MTSPDSGLACRLETLSLGIAEALAGQCDRHHGFAETEFYGTAFACMLWCRWPDRFAADLEAGLMRLKQQDKRARIGLWENPFHWEFVRFALADLFRHGSVAAFHGSDEVLEKPAFVGTRVANWMLLRSTARIAEGRGTWLGRLERRVALSVYQQPGGFIEDQRGAPTQQYHAFMTALLGYQIVVLGEDSAFLHTRFETALTALQRTALHDGEVNAIGRGQFQSFGYAASILALAYGLRLGLAAEGAQTLLELVLQRLERSVAADGALPLMLIEAAGAPGTPPVHPHQSRIGWHSYNNGPDYLAFTGAALKLAAEQLTGMTLSSRPLSPPEQDTLSDGIRAVRTPVWSAILTLPHAGLTAAQPLPYIVLPSGARPLPAYGGETLPESIYTALAQPLPVLEAPPGTFRTLFGGALFRWDGPDKIVGEGTSFRFERRFDFTDDMITIEDALILNQPDPEMRLHLPWLPMPDGCDATDNGTVFKLDGARLESDLPLTPVETAGRQYGMSGALRIWSHATAAPSGGDVARAAYRVRLTP
ncbi:hypothetical protein NUH88_10155 [Nisaea acidiphila]|uniref:Heparinase n=1 Tax=Nisaea acidiphila TaxID=1862145 RepID=A0A9J7B321_9PROT|nr:hypothetical protein [Nisaea acidiphila]UUX52045.1 hypothetical protein NUH88_10155 [Nisaea acidiphila]